MNKNEKTVLSDKNNFFAQLKKNVSDTEDSDFVNRSNYRVANVCNNVNGPSDDDSTDAKWPDLTVDLIGSSLKVIADLRVGYKLKIVSRNRLAEDNSYVYGLLRYGEDKKRENIISFLDHLFAETERNIWIILADIRQGHNVDTNVCTLHGLVYKIHIFLHRYENMRSAYKEDSDVFTRLGLIRDKFFTFLNVLFRDMAVTKN